MMERLIIDLERVSLRGDGHRLLRGELERLGLTFGCLTVGDVVAAPAVAYLLWHEDGDVPVSMLVVRDELQDIDGACRAAAVFVSKWRRRLANQTEAGNGGDRPVS